MSTEVYRAFYVSMDRYTPAKHSFSIVATENGAEYVLPTGAEEDGLNADRINQSIEHYNEKDEPLPANPKGWAILAMGNLSMYGLHPLPNEWERKIMLDEEPKDAVRMERIYLDYLYGIDTEEQKKTVTAAGEGETCPPATQNISLNLKNRQNAIDTAAYGPLNPDRPNDEFWQKKADHWQTDVQEAKSSRCGNCAAFFITPRIKDCIDAGLGNEQGNDAWATIAAGNLGYCEAFDFKCASKRTCDAWIVGGPITEEKGQNG